MRASLMIALCATLLVSAFVISRAPRRSQPGAAADSEQIAELERRIETLQGRVRAAEAVSASALARSSEPRAASASPGDEAQQPAGSAPTAAFSYEQQAAIFKDYFEQLDQLKGPGNDSAAVQRFSDKLSSAEWQPGSPGGPASRQIACANGYCRVSLTFKDAGAALDARMKLALDVQPLPSGMSIFYDPEHVSVEGYFALDGKTLPPFPGTVVAASTD